jgi:hypothetical protein
MPRLPRSARLQIVHKEQSGSKYSEVSAGSVSTGSTQGAFTPLSEFNAGEEALESVKAVPKTRREEGIWIDVDLNDGAPETCPRHLPVQTPRIIDDGSRLALPMDEADVADEESSPPLVNATTCGLPWSLGPRMSVGNSRSSSNVPNSQAKSDKCLRLSIAAPPWTPKVESNSENKDPNATPPRAPSKLNNSPDNLQLIKVTLEERRAKIVPRSSSCLPFRTRNSASLFEDLERPYEQWSDGLIQTITQESKMAMSVNSPEVITFFFASEECDSACSTRPPSSDGAGTGRSSETFGASEPSDATDRGDSLFATLAEVADRPFPLECLLLSTAFARLVGTGAGEGTRRPVTVNSGHHEVEALLLKYTAFASRRDLRTELEAWFPEIPIARSRLRQRYDLVQQSQGACHSKGSSKQYLTPLAHRIEGPDDDGPSLSFEAMTAFIATHAAPKSVLAEAFHSMGKKLGQPCDGDSSARLAPRRMARQGLEAALVPLLAGLQSAAAGNGRLATLAARRIASSAAVLAIRGHDRELDLDTLFSAEASGEGSNHWLSMDEFEDLFRKAASLARMSTMHLTGDTKRWQNCIPSPSPRVDLRCSMGGG